MRSHVCPIAVLALGPDDVGAPELDDVREPHALREEREEEPVADLREAGPRSSASMART